MSDKILKADKAQAKPNYECDENKTFKPFRTYWNETCAESIEHADSCIENHTVQYERHENSEYRRNIVHNC